MCPGLNALRELPKNHLKLTVVIRVRGLVSLDLTAWSYKVQRHRPVCVDWGTWVLITCQTLYIHFCFENLCLMNDPKSKTVQDTWTQIGLTKRHGSSSAPAVAGIDPHQPLQSQELMWVYASCSLRSIFLGSEGFNGVNIIFKKPAACLASRSLQPVWPHVGIRSH